MRFTVEHNEEDRAPTESIVARIDYSLISQNVAKTIETENQERKITLENSRFGEIRLLSPCKRVGNRTLRTENPR